MGTGNSNIEDFDIVNMENSVNDRNDTKEMKTPRSRGKKRRKSFLNLDWIVCSLTILSIIVALYSLVFVTLHTNIDINKNEKGEISVSIDYNKDNVVEMPGKDIMPMVEELLKVIKNRK